MFRFLKITLLWLVMIALPAQGFASAIMLGCGASRDHAVAGSAVMHDHASHMTHVAHMHVGHAADHHGNSGGDQIAAADHGGSTAPHGLPGKCSACASCCLGTIAFTSVNAAFTPEVAGLTTTLFPEKPFTVNFPDGLERPPHTLSL